MRYRRPTDQDSFREAMIGEYYQVLLLKIEDQQIVIADLQVQVHRWERVRLGLEALKRDNGGFDYKIIFHGRKV